MMFLLGMIVMYLITGIVFLVLNSVDADEDIKDIVFGWWLIPIVMLINYIRKHLKK